MLVEQINLFDLLENGAAIKKPKINIKSLSANQRRKLMDEYEECVKGLKFRYKDHNSTLKSGGGDLFWPDGTSLFLLRNQLIYSKEKLKEWNELYGLELPTEYFFEMPPKYPIDYMAKNSIACILRTEGDRGRTYTDEELKQWREAHCG